MISILIFFRHFRIGMRCLKLTSVAPVGQNQCK